MKRLACLSVLLLIGCTNGQQEPLGLVANPQYQAGGGPPGWSLAIGDDLIALRLGHDNFDGDVAYAIYSFPRALPRTADGVRRWESADGTFVITVEARPGPCERGAGLRFEDNVTVRLSGRELTGCGGRLTGERN